MLRMPRRDSVRKTPDTRLGEASQRSRVPNHERVPECLTRRKTTSSSLATTTTGPVAARSSGPSSIPAPSHVATAGRFASHALSLFAEPAASCCTSNSVHVFVGPAGLSTFGAASGWSAASVRPNGSTDGFADFKPRSRDARSLSMGSIKYSRTIWLC